MILSDIWSECGRLLGDPNNDKWAQSVLTSRANLAQTEIQGYTNAVVTTESLTPVASSSELSVNSNTMDIVRATKLTSSGERRPFPGMTIEELDFLYPDWQQWSDGEPLYWYYYSSSQKMFLVPKPNAANAIVGGIVAYESRKPTDLSASTDTPFDATTAMIPYHYTIVHWVVAHCFMDDGTPEALGKSRFHRSGSMLNPGEYEKQLGRIMAEFNVIEAIPGHILWQPQGGRVGSWWVPSKSNPLPW